MTTAELPFTIKLEVWEDDYAHPIKTVELDLTTLLPNYDDEDREWIASEIFNAGYNDGHEVDEFFYQASRMGLVAHDGPFTVDLSPTVSNNMVKHGTC